MKNVAHLFGLLKGENVAYLVPKTLKVKNVACLLSDRSRALARAYVLKRQDDILFSIKNLILLMVKYMYMQSQKSQPQNLTGGGGLAGN